MIIISLFFGFILWYCYYGVECAINGGTICRNQWFFHFPLLWEEFKWILPGGFNRKLNYTNGDIELAKTLPGIPHFIFTHMFIPLIPFLLISMFI